ncbi:MAG: hypothetical protein ISS02_02555 [Candidatus Portnoybacteria bacterium]|nr:hypothetical protein [Candidatus Portnoybacteria bacterium]
MIRQLLICLVLLSFATNVLAINSKPDINDTWSTKKQLIEQFVRYYSTGGKLSNTDLWNASRLILDTNTDPTTQAWGWAMMIEYCTSKGFGSEQFARWGLGLIKSKISPKNFQLINVRLKSHGGASMLMKY